MTGEGCPVCGKPYYVDLKSNQTFHPGGAHHVQFDAVAPPRPSHQRVVVIASVQQTSRIFDYTQIDGKRRWPLMSRNSSARRHTR